MVPVSVVPWVLLRYRLFPTTSIRFLFSLEIPSVSDRDRNKQTLTFLAISSTMFRLKTEVLTFSSSAVVPPA